MTRIFTALMATMMVWSSCTASPKAAENVTVDTKFTAISAADNVDVYYTPGKNVSVKIEAPKRVIANVKTDVKGNTLKIYTEGNVELNNKEKIKVYVTAAGVNAFTASDNADIHCQTALSVENLAVSVKDNADFKAPALNVNNLAVNCKDNGEVKVSQGVMAGNVAVTVNDNAEFKTPSISANEVALSATDNGEIKLKDCGIERMTAVAGDNAEIKLTGKCSVVSYTAKGKATITADELLANGGVASASDMATIRSNVASLQTNLDGEMASIKNFRQ